MTRISPKEEESVSKVSRRQFITTAAGATAVSAFPHVWIRPAWAQTKEVRVLAWTHFVPAYDKPTRGVWRYEGHDAEFRTGEGWRDAYKSTD